MQLTDISRIVKPLAEKYGVKNIYLFGSYARGEATEESDLDFLVYWGESLRKTFIFALGEELREVFQKKVDIFEISEINPGSKFYQSVMKDRVLIA